MNIGLPPELYTIWEAYPWRFGEPYCLFKTFLTEFMSSASVLTILAFTVERYVAICHPLRAQAVSTPARAVKTLIAVWIGAALSALPYPLHTRTYYYVYDPRHSDDRTHTSISPATPAHHSDDRTHAWISPATPARHSDARTHTSISPATLARHSDDRTHIWISPATPARHSDVRPLTDSLVCNIPLPWMSQMKYVVPASTLLLFVAPMCVMTALYVSIALELRRRSSARTSYISGASHGDDRGARGGGRGTGLLRQHSGAAVTADQHQRLSPQFTIQQFPNSRRTVVRILGENYHWQSGQLAVLSGRVDFIYCFVKCFAAAESVRCWSYGISELHC